MWNQPQNKLWYRPGMSIARPDEQPDVWLEKKEDVYVLSEQEMLDLLTTTYNAGRSYQYELDRNIPEKEMSSCNQGEWVELKMNGTIGKK